MHKSNQSIIKAGLYMSLFNLATLLPAILLAFITNDMLNSYFGQSTAEVGIWGYWGISLVIFLIIFLTSYVKFILVPYLLLVSVYCL